MFCFYLILSNTLPEETNPNVAYNVIRNHEGIIIVRLLIMCFILTITILSECDDYKWILFSIIMCIYLHTGLESEKYVEGKE